MLTGRWFGLSSRPSLDQLSLELARFLAERCDVPATLFGAEHEFRVVTSDARSRQVDFRRHVHGLGLGRPRLDPDDPYSYRLQSGNAVTCDEAEAEIALAPDYSVPGAASRLAARAQHERATLEQILRPTLTLRGHSTHVSVSVATDLVERVGEVFARSFGAPVIRLVNSPDRCGIWVRPRHERLELCLDYVDGDRLVAVATFCIAAVRACIASVEGATNPEIPGRLRVQAGPSRHRSGWHLGRHAFPGGDPLADDEKAPLLLESGGSIAAGEHLQAAWSTVRALAQETASHDELNLVDALVAGRALHELPTWCETSESLPAAYGDALRARDRGTFEVAAVAVTWHFAVFLLLRTQGRNPRRAFACVPRPQLEPFLEALDAGALDRLLESYLYERPAGRVLEKRGQSESAGLFDRLGLRRALLPMDPSVASALAPSDRQAA